MTKMLFGLLLLASTQVFANNNLEGFERVYRGDFAEMKSFKVQLKAVPFEQIVVKNLTDGARIKIETLSLSNRYNYDSFIELGDQSAVNILDIYRKYLDERKMKAYDDLTIKLGIDYNSPEWLEVTEMRLKQIRQDTNRSGGVKLQSFVRSGEFEIYIKYNHDKEPSPTEWSYAQIQNYPLETLQNGDQKALFSCIVDHRLGGIPATIKGIKNPMQFDETLNLVSARKGIISCQAER